MNFIHLSDVHIGKSRNEERFATIVGWIVANPQEHKAKVVVITGDLVDDGALGQYRAFKQQKDRLEGAGLLVLTTPGNHDYGFSGIFESSEAMARYQEFASGGVGYPYVAEVDGCAFILLDSMLQEMIDHEIWGAQGELGQQQLADLDRILNDIEENRPDSKVVIALHHHPFYYRYVMTLRDNRRFKSVIADKDGGDARVDCLLFGHKHNEHRFAEKEIEYHIGVIYASGASTERDDGGNLVVPVIDAAASTLVRNRI